MIKALNRSLYNGYLWDSLNKIANVSETKYESDNDMVKNIIFIAITNSGITTMKNNKWIFPKMQFIPSDSEMDEIYHDLLKEYYVLSYNNNSDDILLLHKNYVKNNKDFFHMWNDHADGNFISPCLRSFDLKQNYDADVCIRTENDQEISELYGVEYAKELDRCKNTNFNLAHMYQHAATLQAERFNNLSADLRLLFELSDDKD